MRKYKTWSQDEDTVILDGLKADLKELYKQACTIEDLDEMEEQDSTVYRLWLISFILGRTFQSTNMRYYRVLRPKLELELKKREVKKSLWSKVKMFFNTKNKLWKY